jgi:hypothetical protein
MNKISVKFGKSLLSNKKIIKSIEIDKTQDILQKTSEWIKIKPKLITIEKDNNESFQAFIGIFL